MFRPIRFIKDEYVQAYRGLPRRAWILFAVNLVNSSGSMVIFFLSLYLTRELGLTTARAGQALSLYGVGSLVGAYAGGWLADRIGSIAVQKMSLAMCGVALVALGQVRTMAGILPLLFAFAMFAGTLYPANATSMSKICPPGLQVKGFALNRLAGNLGATIGPAIGGFAGASRLPAPLLGRRPDLARRGGRVRAAVARDADLRPRIRPRTWTRKPCRRRDRRNRRRRPRQRQRGQGRRSKATRKPDPAAARPGATSRSSRCYSSSSSGTPCSSRS